MIKGNAMIDEDSRIGTLTWEACKDCKHYKENGCKFSASTIFDYGLKVWAGVMYCSLFIKTGTTSNHLRQGEDAMKQGDDNTTLIKRYDCEICGRNTKILQKTIDSLGEQRVNQLINEHICYGCWYEKYIK